MKARFKQCIITFLFVFTVISFSAQGDGKHKNENNELKINMGSLLFEFPELSYEYILNEESSVGISLAFPLDKEISYRFIVYPNYRIYFGKKRAAGFFMEVNSAVFSQQNETFIFGGSLDSNNSETKMGFGLGIAVGGKFLTKNGFIGEIYIGGGRNFMNTDEIDNGYPRAGISIGKRF
jgi:hypothetical protein